MKKRLISLLIAVTMLISFVPVIANAETITYGDLTFDKSTGAITVCDTSASGDLVIPSTIDGVNVTSIGDSAFYYCSGITSITIPDSVTSIGERAFRWCNGLTNIEIPNGVTSIGKEVFEGCSSVTSIEIPNSVTSIGQSAFASCSSVTSIEIPNSVTSIGNNAFGGCNSLTSIEIPNSVTSIGVNVFSYCNSLTSIEIPNSVTSIGGDGAFFACESLTSIEIPNSVTSIGDNAFAYCSSLTSIEIPNSITSIGNEAFAYCKSLTDVYYSGSESEWNNISIDSYNKYLINATIHYNSTMPKGTNSTSNSAPIITSAKLSHGSATYDLFSDKLNITKDSADTYSAECIVNANGGTDVHVYLTQGSASAVEIPLNACRDIQIGKTFSAGQPIYVTAIDKKTGKSTSKRTKLSVVGDSMAEGSLSGGAISIADAFSVDVPDSVPVLGGQSFGLSLGSISSEVEIDGNEFKVSVGTDFLDGKKDDDGKWKKEDWEGFKKGFKSAKDKMRSGKGAYKYLKNIAPKSTKMELSKGVGGSANVTGYIEGYIDDAGIHPTEGGIIVSAEIKYTYQGMVVVVVVPLYYEIGAGGELTFVGGVKDLLPGNGLQGAWTGSITPAVFFEVGGGVGVPYIFTVGASGKVKAELEIALDKIYQKLDITGTAKFELKGPLGIPTYEKPFAEGTFHVYETGNKKTLLGKTLNMYSVDEDNDNPYASIDIDAPLALTEHSESTQNWVGNNENVELAAVDYTNQDVNVLEINSYENIAPILAEMDGKNVIAWITDNKGRANGDKDMLVYSVEENGKWSEPVAVYDDGFADSNPAMQDGYIVWQKVTKSVTSDMSMRDLGKVSEIYLAKWNGSGFDSPIRITDNALLDQAPKLSVNDGNATVVWVQNSDNNFMGTTGENSIMSYTDGTVKTEKVISTSITNMSVTHIDGALNIAYETDGDNDLSTLEDREIYNIENGIINRITNNSLIDTHPVYGKVDNETVLFYYSDGKIVYLESGVENAVLESGVTTDQFAVISNGEDTAVLWTMVQDGSAELHGVLYDGSIWSEDVQVSDLGERIKYPSAVMQSDGSIFAAFNRTEKVANEYYYDDGQADLCTIKITPSYDLELIDAYFDEENMKAYATVKNNGEISIDGFNVTLGNDKKTITKTLNAGESTDIEIEYSKPSDFSARMLILSVSLINGDEYVADNNSAEFSVGNADVLVSNVAVDEEETKITADISNIGYKDAKNVTVNLREESSNGRVIANKTVSILIDSNQGIEFDINKADIRFYNALTPLYITAECNDAEISLGNNDGYVVISSDSGLADFENDILDYTKVDDKFVINSVAVNNTDEEVSCKLYSAVYSSDGVMKYCGGVEACIEANDDTGVDITVPCAIESGDVIKTFMWSDTMEALAKVSEFKVE